MHHGRGVVAFATGGIPDWLEDGRTGLLVAPQDIQAMSAALSRGLFEPQLAETFGLAARERVRARFDFHRSIDGIERALSGPVAAAKAVA